MSMRPSISLWVSQFIAVWLPLQYTQHNLLSAVLLGCGLWAVDVKREAVDGKLVWKGEDACWPASKILISLRRADWSSWIVHSTLCWLLAMFLFVSSGNFVNTVCTNRVSSASGDLPRDSRQRIWLSTVLWNSLKLHSLFEGLGRSTKAWMWLLIIRRGFP